MGVMLKRNLIDRVYAIVSLVPKMRNPWRAFLPGTGALLLTTALNH
ncbi:hypothetical protein H4S14_004207 [Agrobacterium vitis]|nr:hypothetical protein [Agrobacterium vitis]MBE1440433.1 hypothetical protein [Agrobacterium vitis]